jgi:hypothetical protein
MSRFILTAALKANQRQTLFSAITMTVKKCWEGSSQPFVLSSQRFRESRRFLSIPELPPSINLTLAAVVNLELGRASRSIRLH